MNAVVERRRESDELGLILGDAVAATARQARSFPAWHFRMMNDDERNWAIESSIASLDLENKIVFEVGTGCGLIALLFAKYGARHVYTCEANPQMAEVAQSIIGPSEFANKITVLAMPSSEVLDRGLLPGTPDVIFTETLDTAVLGEGFISIAADISRLAGPDTIVMPRAVRQYCVPIESEDITGLNRVSTACGFDLSALNAFSTVNFLSVESRLYDLRHMAEEMLIRTYSYRSVLPPVPCVFEIENDGQLHGFLSWFKADFGYGVVTNKPGMRSHWKQAFHPLRDVTKVKRGDRLTVLFDDSGAAVVSRLMR